MRNLSFPSVCRGAPESLQIQHRNGIETESPHASIRLGVDCRTVLGIMSASGDPDSPAKVHSRDVSHHLIQPAIPTNERNEMVFTRMQDDEQGQGEGPHSNTWTLDLGRRYVGCYHMDVLRDLVILLSTNEYG